MDAIGSQTGQECCSMAKVIMQRFVFEKSLLWPGDFSVNKNLI